MAIRKYAKLFLIASASSHTHKTILFTEPNNPYLEFLFFVVEMDMPMTVSNPRNYVNT